MDVRREFLYDSVEKYIQGRNTYQCKLRILYLNARSLIHKLEEVELLLLRIGVHIIVIAETWLKPSISQYYDIKDYEAYHVTSERIGGVSIYILESWKATVNSMINSDHSILQIIINKQNDLYELIAIYNPNENNATPFLNDLEDIT
jgi:hypothetical protein